MQERIKSKIKTRDELLQHMPALKAGGKKAGYTSGTFDLLHPGHVLYLEEARLLCDVLIVGVNSDASVRGYKNPLRPVMPERDRVLVTAGLASVDYVFIFDELNNNVNIKLLQPDVYIKAGDYEKAALSSAAIVEAYGGKVCLVPFEKGYSTTSTIDHISEMAKAQSAGFVESAPPVKKPAVFVDRDGTIADHVDYLHEPEKFKLIPGAMEGLKKLQDAGFRIVIVTNQPGIGLGYFSKEDFFRVNLAMLKSANRGGVRIDKVYFCPHSKAEVCTCRKPGTAMVERAVSELNVDLARSFVIGDMTLDVKLGRNAGCGAVLVKTGYGGKDAICDAKADYEANDLLGAAEWILANSG